VLDLAFVVSGVLSLWLVGSFVWISGSHPPLSLTHWKEGRAASLSSVKVLVQPTHLKCQKAAREFHELKWGAAYAGSLNVETWTILPWHLGTRRVKQNAKNAEMLLAGEFGVWGARVVYAREKAVPHETYFANEGSFVPFAKTRSRPRVLLNVLISTLVCCRACSSYSMHRAIRSRQPYSNNLWR
jgi:hypothetical protein